MCASRQKDRHSLAGGGEGKIEFVLHVVTDIREC